MDVFLKRKPCALFSIKLLELLFDGVDKNKFAKNKFGQLLFPLYKISQLNRQLFTSGYKKVVNN